MVDGSTVYTLLYGISDDLLHHLQSVQDAAAHLMMGAHWRDHTPLLRQLHWLPVRQQVIFKVVWAWLVHQSLAGVAPSYLADDCCLLSDTGWCTLRSTSNDIRTLIVLPNTQQIR